MRPNPLTIIALVFAASFSGRAISMASAAVKGSEKAPAQNAAPVQPQAAAGAPKETPAASTPQPAPRAAATKPDQPASADHENGDRDPLLAAIRQRAAELDKREAEIAQRERVLDVLEKRVDEKTAELKKVKAELESRLSFAETASQNDIARLAKMYESMKPQKAGEIFNQMEPSFAAGFLTEMTPDAAALILSNMETQKAYAASVIIAGRNASVNK
ncbi:MAG: hypothetical protein GC153_13610 [Alphaproteobacteria bacterium]|nr:hypothetical protein [Alphaproteobacteria bacterium]